MATAKKSQVKLLGEVYSPYVLRVCIALNLKNVEYEFIKESLLGPRSELLQKSNPVNKKMPVLIHDDKPISESLVILEYIDEVWNLSGCPSILPSDPYERSVARFWANYIDEKVTAPIKAVAIARSDDAREAARKQVEETIVLLEKTHVESIKDERQALFFGGKHIGFLDIVLGSYLGWLKAVEKIHGVKLLDDSKSPSLSEWAYRFCSDASVRNVIPATDELVEFVMMLRTRAEGRYKKNRR